MNNYRGIEDISILWHGDWADPEMEYAGMTVNYWAVENAIYEEYKATGRDPNNEFAFSAYCVDHADRVRQLIADIWNQSRS